MEKRRQGWEAAKLQVKASAQQAGGPSAIPRIHSFKPNVTVYTWGPIFREVKTGDQLGLTTSQPSMFAE